jgi:asparagine synthase (glutamine-hydrolysing)
LFRSKRDFVSDVVPSPDSAGDWVSRLEQRAYMSFVLLRDIDAMSMAHSMEVRLPFLDRQFGDVISRIPWQWKLGDGSGKWILKKALRGILPNETLDRTQKMGFGLPWKLWLRRSLGEAVRDVLCERSIKDVGILDNTQVDKVLKKFYDGDNSLHRQVWTMFVLQEWVSKVLRRK